MPEKVNPPYELIRIGLWRESRATAVLILASAVFLASLFGIYTRPMDFLAAVWPANAIMLGLLIRMPGAANVFGWLSATAAFMAADLLTGSSLFKAAILNSANLLGVATGYLIYSRLSPEVIRLRHPSSMLDLALASSISASVAGLVGGVANPVLFDRSIINGWTFWFATEFVNYIVILPIILSAPSLTQLMDSWRQLLARRNPADFAPIAALLLSGLAAMMIGGPGAIAFPVPALLWCGLVYSVFPTAVLTLVFGVWTLAILSNASDISPIDSSDEVALISLRLGISLIALAPIMLASVMRNRDELLERLRHMAMHDPLTGTPNRNAFRETAHRLLERRPNSFATLMIDIDHFKSVNDRFGHAAGDHVLAIFAQRASRCLRPQDILARMGGEEFAVLVPDCSEREASAIADRIRAAASLPIVLDDGRSLTVTVSVGLVILSDRTVASIDGILADADALLYRAKDNGRDRVEIYVRT